MKIEVLNAVNDAAAWHELMGKLPAQMQDMYFMPEYMALQSAGPDLQAVCFVFSAEQLVWMYPSLLRRFSVVGGKKLDRDYYDLESAYGYGGPISNSTDQGFLSKAHAAFHEWCQGHGVIAEFSRLHPLLQNQCFLDPEVQVLLDRDTRSLELTKLDPEQPPFDGTSRNMLRKAERSGVIVERASLDKDWPQFVALYCKTMDRVGADAFYYFSDSYFSGLRELARKSGFLLAAKLGEKLLSAAVFFKGQSYLHYHISATDPDHRMPGATNQVIWQAGLLGRQAGLTRLHLGGGRTREAGDSLLRFKTSMSTDTHPFYIAKRVHNKEAYSLVKNLWATEYPDLASQYGQQILCYHNQPAKTYAK